ncbi:YceI family protein [Leptospira sarikeiensis]|uniref:YceI family protein n=1 Tax=Leptospira sarikeiensis TaxID=2484943 RepID=A0A4R9K5A7_9LEPT|nr:YceI family protein [Leptospira sarikeiensis]TGL59538.1 YceI family protein [Leptospira sarikeiensis]
MFRILIFSILLILSFTNIHSEELKLQETQIQFIAIHPFKTVIGNCPGAKVSPLSLNKTAAGIQTPKSVQIEIPIKEIRSGDESRDEHILELLGYPTISQISFTSTSIQANGDEWVISGNLTVKGKTKLIQSVAKLEEDSGKTILSGKFQVLMSDFDVERPSLLFATAKDDVSIEYKFILKP